MKKIIITLLLGVLCLPAFAQEYAPKQGTIQGSLLLGNGMFYTNSQYDLFIDKTQTTTSLGLPARPSTLLKITDVNSNSITNMIGAEFKYFVTDQIAVSFTGMGVINTTPAREGVEAVSTLPSLKQIEAELGSRLGVSIAGNYYLKLKNERVQPYVGIAGTFQFAQISVEQSYDATNINDLGYGARTGQMFGWSPALVAGLEYSLTPSLIFGMEIKPFSYQYSAIQLFAQPGMASLDGVNNEFSFFSQPRFKIGFRF